MRLITILLIMALIVTALGIGCGALDTSCQDAKDAPDGALITINPPSRSVTDTNTTITTHTDFFTITVKDREGNSMNKTRITLFYPWAFPDPSAVVQLYDGATPMNAPFATCTNDFGIYTLRYDYQSGGLTYTGDLTVRSGTAYGAATFSVAQ